MSHQLLRLSQKVYNTPHLITSSAFQSISDYLEKRNLDDFVIDKELAIQSKRNKSIDKLQYNADTKVGVIPVEGTLSYVAHYGLCSGESASYQGILADTKAMLAAGAKTLVIDADSGGGEAYGMMETASEIRKLADEHNAKLITYVDGIAASAMYGMASTSHEIIVNPEAEVGSIGVVVSLANYSEAEKKYGIKRTFITAGDSKVPWDADGEFKQEFLDDIQMKVDLLYEKFTNHVATNRNLSQDQVKSYGAKVYVAEDALSKGLVDGVMTREEFFNYLGEVAERGDNDMSLNLFKSKNEGTKMSQEDTSDFAVQLATALADHKVKWEAEKAPIVEKLQNELNEVKAALEAAQTAQKEAKALARKTELKTLLGDEKGEAKFAQLENADDATFSLVVETIKESRAATKDTDPMFSEMGDVGQEQLSDADLEKKARLAEKERLAKKFAHANK